MLESQNVVVRWTELQLLTKIENQFRKGDFDSLWSYFILANVVSDGENFLSYKETADSFDSAWQRQEWTGLLLFNPSITSLITRMSSG